MKKKFKINYIFKKPIQVDVEETKPARHLNRQGGADAIMVIGVMIVTGLLMTAGISAMMQFIANGRNSAASQDIGGIVTTIEQFVAENPRYLKEKNASVIADHLNSYFEGEMQFASLPKDSDSLSAPAESWILKRIDPYGNNYRIVIDTQPHVAVNGKNPKNDSELRIFVVSNGNNGITGATNGELDGTDDIFGMVQCVNGNVSKGYYGARNSETTFVKDVQGTAAANAQIYNSYLRKPVEIVGDLAGHNITNDDVSNAAYITNLGAVSTAGTVTTQITGSAT